LSFAAEQIKELLKGHQIIVEWLGLQSCSDSTSARWAATAHLTLVNCRIVLTWLTVGVRIVDKLLLRRLIRHHLTIVLVLLCKVASRASLHDFFVGQEWQGTEFLGSDGLGRVGSRLGAPTDEHPAFLLRFVVSAQVQEALSNADDFLQRAVAINVVLVPESWILFCQL